MNYLALYSINICSEMFLIKVLDQNLSCARTKNVLFYFAKRTSSLRVIVLRLLHVNASVTYQK